MELNVETLQNKEQSLIAELTTFAQTGQAEINALETALRNKVRETQKGIDQLEGKIISTRELIAQLKEQAKPSEKEPDNVTPLPVAPSKPSEKPGK